MFCSVSLCFSISIYCRRPQTGAPPDRHPIGLHDNRSWSSSKEREPQTGPGNAKIASLKSASTPLPLLKRPSDIEMNEKGKYRRKTRRTREGQQSWCTCPLAVLRSFDLPGLASGLFLGYLSINRTSLSQDLRRYLSLLGQKSNILTSSTTLQGFQWPLRACGGADEPLKAAHWSR